MRIRVPKFIVSAWGHFCDWGDIPVFWKVRRIDVLLGVGFVICVSWYQYTIGWKGAIVGGMFYILMVMVSIWFL